ncbi:MAG: response regulator transcription factor [Dysgonamonadaceae bacterium]|jgi:DNA-binding NarL/FixJ family response regulator|nr:response regulator transcription factor [Dysgonamonadaceae bacterium]
MEKEIYILADNQDISKMGIRYLLNFNNIEGKVIEVKTKKELINMLAVNSEAVVVLDYTNFDFTHIEDLLVVASRFSSVSWLLFSDELSLSFLKRIYIEKTFSIVLKNSTCDEISIALVTVRQSERYICSTIANYLNSQDNKDSEKQLLTSTEQEILRQIAVGRSVKEIAEERCSSLHTINTHKKNIFRKLEVNNVFEARKYALRAGLVDVMDYYI